MSLKSLKDDFGCLMPIGIVVLCLLLIIIKKHTDKDPYSEGEHISYEIICENGFIYQHYYRRGIIQVRNSDGTFARCGQPVY